MPYDRALQIRQADRLKRAGEAVRDSLQLDQSTRHAALADLAAADPVRDAAIPASGPDDRLAAAALDAVGSELLLAGAAAGPGDTRSLERSIGHAAELARNAGSDVTPGAAFDGPPTVTSAELGVAQRTFKARGREALTDVVAETTDTLWAAIDELSKRDAAAVLEAIRGIGLLAVAEAAEGIVRDAVARLKRATDALVEMVGDGPLKGIRDEIERLWNKARDQGVDRAAVRAALRCGGVETAIDGLFANRGHTIGLIDGASGSVYVIAAAHHDRMAKLRSILRSIVWAGILLGLAGLAWAPLFVVGGCVLVLGVALVLGGAAVGSWPLPGLGQSVRGVVDDLA